jgi:hypothetical protein
LRFESQAALFGRFKLLLAFFELAVEIADRRADPGAVTDHVLLAQDVEQLLHHIARQHGIFGIGQIAAPDFGGDLEQVVLLARHLDLLLKLAGHRIERAALENPEIAKGINIMAGKVTYPGVAQAFGLKYTPLEKVLGGRRRAR